jgi:hypothetical protein
VVLGVLGVNGFVSCWVRVRFTWDLSTQQLALECEVLSNE